MTTGESAREEMERSRRRWRRWGWGTATGVSLALLLVSVSVANCIAMVQDAASPGENAPVLPVGVFTRSGDAAALKSAAPGYTWTALMNFGQSGTSAAIGLARPIDLYHSGASRIDKSLPSGRLDRAVTIVFELPARIEHRGAQSDGELARIRDFLDAGWKLPWQSDQCASWTLPDGSEGGVAPTIEDDPELRTRVTCEIPAIGKFSSLSIGWSVESNDALPPRTIAGQSPIVVASLTAPIDLPDDRTDIGVPFTTVGPENYAVVVSEGLTFSGDIGATGTSRFRVGSVAPGDYLPVSLVDRSAYAWSQTLMQFAWVIVGLAGGWFAVASYHLMKAFRRDGDIIDKLFSRLGRAPTRARSLTTRGDK